MGDSETVSPATDPRIAPATAPATAGIPETPGGPETPRSAPALPQEALEIASGYAFSRPTLDLGALLWDGQCLPDVRSASRC